MTMTATLNTLWSFASSTSGNEQQDGFDPQPGLVLDAKGDLFGTTNGGGSNEAGTVYEIANTASGYATSPILFNFDGTTNGAFPQGGLAIDAHGNLFGGTFDSPNNDFGGIFELVNTSSGYSAPTTLVNGFGVEPNFVSSPFFDKHGDLFITAGPQGLLSQGAIFELVHTKSGYSAPTMLVGNGAIGGQPEGTLIADNGGDLFWATKNGGLFELVHTNSGYASTPTMLADFTNQQIRGGLIVDAHGDLFGTTYNGGQDGVGTVFELVNTGKGYASTPTTLVEFNGYNGANPEGGLIMDAAGNLFGTTYGGGQFGDGTVFEIAKTAAGYVGPTILHSFDASAPASEGANPWGSLVADATGDLFGVTRFGGANGGGTVFEIVGSGFDVGLVGHHLV
jgi:uncharacterized repeat protein (TIGR03803 family)